MTNKWKHDRSPDEVRSHLERQIGHLRRSAETFDNGTLAEAERLATAVYIICHDGTSRTKSLLTQLKLKSAMRFPDTASRRPPSEGGEFLGPPLCSLQVKGGEGMWWAPLGEGKEKMTRLSFSKWWQQKVYETPRLNLTRQNVVFFMRSQDGGAHVDAQIRSEAYHWLSTNADDRLVTIGTKNGRTGITGNVHRGRTAGIGKPIKNGHWATMRQIAWELDQALIDSGL